LAHGGSVHGALQHATDDHPENKGGLSVLLMVTIGDSGYNGSDNCRRVDTSMVH
jgi:hypothetical protein